MKYLGFATRPKYDTFGNLIVWLPFGIAGQEIKAYKQWDTYTITRQELEDLDNNSTLAGLDVVVGHPEQPLITPDARYPVVGTCTGRWRESTPSVFEVEARIFDSAAIKWVEQQKLVETSAGYVETSPGVRIYNHLALVAKGLARGGRQMTIKFESESEIKTKMTEQEIKDLADTVVAKMRTEAKEAEEYLADVKTEAYNAGLQRGEKQAKLVLRAERAGIKIEAEYAKTVQGALSTYLPSLSKLECCGMSEEVLDAYMEASLVAAEGMSSKKEAEDSQDTEKAKTESEKDGQTVKTPSSVKTESEDDGKYDRPLPRFTL